MRFLTSTSLLVVGALASLIRAADTKEDVAKGADDSQADDTYTTFNGQKVPQLKEVGDKALDELIQDGYTAVKFYSPSCHHCNAMAPAWKTIYEYYWTSKPVPSTNTGNQESLNDFHHYYGFDFANVNCIAYGDSCIQHGVTGFPVIKIFKDGKAVAEYQRKSDMPAMGVETIGKFIEETLETIRPGSRVKDGQVWPEAGASSVEGFSTSAAASTPTAAAKPNTSAAAPAPPKKPKTNKAPSSPSNPHGTSVAFTPESFHTQVTLSQDSWFVKFYAPWCHHCQSLAPIWTELAKEMEGKLNIGEVNCEEHKAFCKEAKIEGYPTLAFFSGGERVDYDGLRGLGDLTRWAGSAIGIGEGVTDVTAAEFKTLEETEEVIFVYFYDHATTSEDFDALDRVILSLIGQATLVKTKDPEMYERFKITTWPRLLVSRDGRPTYYTALAPDDMRDYRLVLQWMQSVWLPIVPELLPGNAREIMDGKLVVLAILTRDRQDEFKSAKNEIKSAAIEWMDKQIHAFQLERQEYRDAKELRIKEAEAKDDQRAVRAAKSIRIDMNRSNRKEVTFAWVDGVFWERWIRTTYGINIADGEKVIINDEDNRRYWDTTINDNPIIPSRTSILETIPKVITSPPKIKPKYTISSLSKVFFDIRRGAGAHPLLTIGLVVAIIVAAVGFGRKSRRSRGGFFRLDDEKNLGLLGGGGNGKVD
ncbi:hypothetical protein V490_08395 [Pseudogymnoascus sp. VKM F-3557]|nr:hypothetical protein V490_08395 [Pseudogymnoascus sp. VKM F-3557]